MNTLINIIFSVIIIYGTISAEMMDKNVDNETISNVNLKSRSIELTTELTEVVNNGNNSDVKSENLTVNTEGDADNNLGTEKTDVIDNTESLADFDDLEYGRNANNNEDDFVDEDRIAAELDKDEISKNNTVVDKNKILGKIDMSTTALIPILEAAVRAGEILKFRTDDTDRSGRFQIKNNEAGREWKPERRMFNPGLVNHEDNAPDYMHFGTVPKNPLQIFGPHFGRFSNQPYLSTPYPPTNGFSFHSFPIGQNTNPYNYMNKYPKSYEYPNSYENSNSYPYIGHRNKDPMPLMPYNQHGSPGQGRDYYRRIVPGFLNEYSNPYRPMTDDTMGLNP